MLGKPLVLQRGNVNTEQCVSELRPSRQRLETLSEPRRNHDTTITEKDQTCTASEADFKRKKETKRGSPKKTTPEIPRYRPTPTRPGHDQQKVTRHHPVRWAARSGVRRAGHRQV